MISEVTVKIALGAEGGALTESVGGGGAVVEAVPPLPELGDEYRYEAMIPPPVGPDSSTEPESDPAYFPPPEEEGDSQSALAEVPEVPSAAEFSSENEGDVPPPPEFAEDDEFAVGDDEAIAPLEDAMTEPKE